MGKVSGNWLTGAHSGRACRHDDIYTKVDKKTGACYSVKLCHPNANWTERQLSQRTSFGAISSAIAAWLKSEAEAGSADYQKVKKQYDRQSKFSTLRGMMYAKGMFTVDAEGNVTVDITANTQGVQAGGGSGGSGSGGSGSDSGGSGNEGGGSSGGGMTDYE